MRGMGSASLDHTSVCRPAGVKPVHNTAVDPNQNSTTGRLAERNAAGRSVVRNNKDPSHTEARCQRVSLGNVIANQNIISRVTFNINSQHSAHARFHQYLNLGKQTLKK